jgi:hypothetical protein
VSLIERELLIFSVVPDSLDVQPSGQGCYSGFAVPIPNHEFRDPTYAAGFKYQICGECGTVRISGHSQSDASVDHHGDLGGDAGSR